MRAVRSVLLLAALLGCAPSSPREESPAGAADGALTRHVVPAPAAAETLPLVVVSTRTVIAIWAVPNDSLLEAVEGLASLYDDFMYYLADARPRLDTLGIANDHAPLAWADRRLRVRTPDTTWTVGLPRDSSQVGYVFVMPGRPPRVHVGMLVDEELADSARAFFGKE